MRRFHFEQCLDCPYKKTIYTVSVKIKAFQYAHYPNLTN